MAMLLSMTVQYQTSYNSMGITERNTMIYQIIGSIRRVGETIFCTAFHDIFVECHGSNHAVEQSQYSL